MKIKLYSPVNKNDYIYCFAKKESFANNKEGDIFSFLFYVSADTEYADKRKLKLKSSLKYVSLSKHYLFLPHKDWGKIMQNNWRKMADLLKEKKDRFSKSTSES